MNIIRDIISGLRRGKAPKSIIVLNSWHAKPGDPKTFTIGVADGKVSEQGYVWRSGNWRPLWRGRVMEHGLPTDDAITARSIVVEHILRQLDAGHAVVISGDMSCEAYVPRGRVEKVRKALVLSARLMDNAF